MAKYIETGPWTLPLTPDSPMSMSSASSSSSSTMLLLLSTRGPSWSQGALDHLPTSSKPSMSQEGHLEALLVAALTRSSSANSSTWLDSRGFHSSLTVLQGCKLALLLLERLVLGSYRLHLLSYSLALVSERLYLLSYTMHLSARLYLLSDMLHFLFRSLDDCWLCHNPHSTDK